MAELTDNMPMPFGKYKGIAMVNVPPDYLIYLYDNGLPDGNVKQYIEDTMDILRKEIIENKQKSKQP